MKEKRFWLLVAVFTLALNTQAQKIQTVDTEGNPVGYASVSDADNGKVIGTTDLDGVLPDVGGVRSIAITHVAFNPQVVTVATLPQDGRIILQDAHRDLPEVTVKRKELIYVQTYYRVFMMHDDTLAYYRSGITDNEYNISKKSVSADHSHYSKAMNGILKFTFDKLLGGMFSRYSNLSVKSLFLGTPTGREKDIVLERETENRQRVNYKGQLIGYMVDDPADHQRRLSIDNVVYSELYHADTDSEKQAKKREKSKEKEKNMVSTRYMVYNIDDDGHCGVADFVTKQVHIDYDRYSETLKRWVHTRIWIEVFATDRCYVDKKELKEKKRSNEVKMTFENLQEFERQHQIPALPDNAMKSLQKLVNK